MKSKRVTIMLIAGTLTLFAGGLIIVVLEICLGSKSMLAGFDRGLQRSYEEVSTGLNKDQVIKTLGNPMSKSDFFCLPQKHGFEHYFDAAEKTSAVEYLLWINGINWYYCIGFDNQSKVVIKGEGHS